MPTFAQQGPTNLNISGGLFYPNGNPIMSSGVNFQVEVYDKTGSCLLYSEVHLGQDLSSTKGGFALELGLGTSVNNAIDSANPTVMTSKVFENSGTIAGGWTGCSSGATLAAGDNRLIRVQYDLGAGYVAMTPDVPIGAAAYSIVAETLQGKRPTDFIQVHDDVTNKLTQANVENVFSSTNYPKLDALLQGSSSQYMTSNPTASVGFNNQRITDLADPTAAQDAATKNYADANIGGQTADLSGIGPATGDGYTLIWDKTAGKWTTGVPSAIDNSKLPLAGGTMTGTIDFAAAIGTGINLNGNDLLGTGHITMSPQKVFNFGTFTTAQETTLVGTLTAAQAGASWYNSTTNEMKIWTGSAAVTQLSSLTAAGGDLTGTYPNPTIANDKILSAMIDSAGAGINRLVISDPTTGAGLKFATCGTNEVLRYEDLNGWVCRDPSTIVTFPVTKVNGKTGDITLNANDLGLGTAALENVGTTPGDVPQLDGSGKIPAALLPAGTGTITGVTAGTGLSGGGTSGTVTLNLADTVVTPGAYGTAGKVATFTVDQQGRLTAAGQTDISIGDANITGVAGSKVSGDIAGNAAGFNGNLAGDVTGTQGATVVGKIQGRTVAATAPNPDEVLMWNGGTSQWEPTAIPSAPVSSVAGRTGAVTLDWGDINSAAGKYMTYKPNNVACGNDEILKFDGTNWVCTSVASALNGDYALSGANTDITSLGAVTSITSTGVLTLSSSANGNIALQPNGTGLVTTSSPLRITPTTLPAAPAAGTIAFDSGASNALKYYNGSAWQMVNTSNATGDFMKDGSVAMTGDFDGGTHNITNVGTVSGSALILSSTGTNNGITLTPNGTGLVTTSSALRVTPTALPAAPAAGTVAFDSGASNVLKYYNGSAWQTVNTSNATGDFMKDGSVAMTGDFNGGAKNLTNIGTNINAVAGLTITTASNNNLNLAPNGTGLVTTSSPLRVTPTALPGAPAAGTIAFDSGSGNAMKYFDGAAWISIGSGTGDFLRNGSLAMTGDFDGGTHNITNIGSVSGSNVSITSTGANNGITLTPNGTGLVTTSSPINVTPSALPAAPVAGTIAFDSGASNALKYYNGSAWQTVNTSNATGDFMKDGSVAMTGNFNAGAHNLTNIGTNVTGAAAVTLASGGTSDLTLTSASGVLNSTTPLKIAPTALPAVPAAGMIAFDSGASNVLKYYNGSAWQTVNTSNATGDFMKDGSVAMTGDFNAGTHNLTAVGSISGSSLSLSSTGANNGITLTPNGTGIVTSSSALRVTPTTLPAGPAAGTIAMDSSTGNAMKYYDGTAWQTLGTGTGTGDFMKNGSIAMTGDFDGGTHNITNIGSVSGSNVSITSTGANNGITLTPNGTGLVTTSSALRVTPTALPAAPAAGTVAFDSGASNALKYYNGSAWQTVNTSNATGDFMKDGSVAMTGDFNGGTKNLTNIGTNIDAAAGLTITTASNNNLNLAPNGTGLVTTSSALRVTPTALPAAPAAGTVAFDSGASNALKYYNGSAWQTVNTSNATGDFMKDGSVAMTGNFNAGTHNLTNIGTNVTGAAALTLASGGTSDLTLTSASGVLSSTTPLKITPTTLPGSPAAGTIAMDSSTGNAMKYYDGTAWQTLGTGTGTGDFMKNGSVAMTGDFNGGTHNITNIGSVSGSALTLTSTGTNNGITLTPNGTGLVTTSSALRVTPTTLPGAPAAGTIAFDSGASNALKYYNGSAWQTVGTGTGNGDFLRNGSLAMTGNFNAGGNSILGNTTPSANLKLESTSDVTKGYVLIQPSGGNVGIGTTSPSVNLSVVSGSDTSGIQIRRNSAGTGSIAMLGLRNATSDSTTNSSQIASIRTNNPSASDAAMAFSITSSTALTEVMRLDSTGYVGIGTTVPARLLHVNGAARLTPTTAPASPAAGDLFFDSTASNALKFYNGSAWQTVGTGTGSGDFMKNGSVAMTGNLKLGANYISNDGGASEGLAFDTSGNANFTGNVGIGTSNPGQKLAVAGSTGVSILVDASSDAGSDANAWFSATSKGYYYSGLLMQSSTNGIAGAVLGSAGTASAGDAYMDLAVGGNSSVNSKVRILESGNIGIGTLTPSTMLDVNGTINATAMTINGVPVSAGTGDNLGNHTATQNLDLANHLLVGNGGSSGLAISSGGNIGIGTASPVDLLSFGAVNASATHASLNLSNTALSGASASGTYIGANPASASADFINYQVGGTTKFKVDKNGKVTGDGSGLTGLSVSPAGSNTNVQFNDSGTLAGAASLNWDKTNGYLGIGSAPNSDLWIQTTSTTPFKIANPTMTSGQSVGMVLTRANTGSDSVELKYVYDTTAANRAFQIRHINGGGTLTLLDGGNVGIGTAAPARPLHVNGAARLTPTTAPSSPAAGDLFFDSTASNALKFYDGTAWQTVGTGTGAGDFMKNGSVAMTGNLKLGTNYISNDGGASEGLAFDTSGNAHFTGNVGIGTATPGSPLTVTGLIESTSSGFKFPDGSIQTTAAVGSGANTMLSNWPDYIQCSSSTSTTYFTILYKDLTNGQVTYSYQDNSGVYNLKYDSTGAYFSNTGSVLSGYDCKDSARSISWLYANGQAFNFVNGSSSSQWTDAGSNIWYNAGSVGIGTNNPARLLQVNGAARFTPTTTPGSAAAGDLFFDSAASNALKFYDGTAWQTVGTGTGTGDFMKNGSVAMTGALNMGSQNITAVGTSITASAGLGISQNSGSILTLGNSGGASGTTVQSGTGGVTISSAGTTATAVNISATGTNGGITMTPNGSGAVKVARIFQVSADSSGLIPSQITNSDWVTGTTGTRVYTKFGATTGNTYASIQVNSNGGMAMGPLILNSSGGNVGVGILSNPTYQFEVTSGSSNTTFLGDNGQVALALRNGNGTANNWNQMAFADGANLMGSVGVQIANHASATADLVFGTANTATMSEKMRITSSGNVGIGTTSPATKLDVNGTINATAMTINGVPVGTGSGDNLGNHTATQNLNLANYLLVGNGGSSGLAISSGGNVGIGTTNASVKMQIEQSSAVTNYGSLSSPDIALYLRNPSNTTNNMNVVSFGDAGGFGVAHMGSINTDQINHYGKLFFATRGADTGVTTQRMVIDSLGNVGIGTTSPTYPLTVSKAPGSYAAVFGDNTGAIAVGAYTGGVPMIQGGSDLSMTSSKPVVLQPFSGSVGIGTTSPTTKLDVNGTINATAMTINGVPVTAGTGDNLGNHTATQNLNLASYQLVGNGGSSGLTVSSGGNVGIGNTSPGNKLTVGSTNGQSNASISARAGNANSFEWGHSNTAGYGSTIGYGSSTGKPFIAFNGEAGTTANTYMSRGKQSSIIQSDLAGGFQFGTVASASADNQAFTPNVTFLADGSVGIGTTTTTMPLTVAGRIASGASGTGGVWVDGGSNQFFGSISGTAMGLYNAGWGIVLNSSGNVGIGTTTPAQKMDVAGNIKATGSVYATSYCDAAGSNCKTPSSLLTAESDTLATVTARGASTSTATTFNGGLGTTWISVNGTLYGGIGATSTGGTLDWNDSSNVRSGSPATLLLGTATNGPGPSNYFHPFNFEYGAKDGSGQVTQFAIPYADSTSIGTGLYLRGRYSGAWSPWRKIISENGSGNVNLTGALTMSGNTVIDAGGGWVRTYGATGWYNSTYGGGMYMSDSSYVRVYGNKVLLADNYIQSSTAMYSPAYYYTSDRRLKQNIREIASPLDKVLALRGVEFDWKNNKVHDIGFIAQEVEKVLPDVVKERPDEKLGTVKTVKYGNIVAVTVEAIKELWNKWMNHEDRIQALEKENLELKTRLERLEKRLDERK